MSRRGRRGVMAASRRRSGGGGTPAFRTSARGNDENTGQDDRMTITVPGTVQALDVMLVIGTQNTDFVTESISGGGSGVTWETKQGPIDTGSQQRAYLWKARATAGSAGSTITVSASERRRFPGLLVVFSGVTDTGILTAVTLNTTAVTSHVFPSVTIPSPGGWALVGLSSLRSQSDVPNSLAGGAPSGSTLDNESNTAAPAKPNLTASGLHTNSTVATGSRTPGTATSTLAGTAILFTVGLAPA